ncbi:hypothetical protein GGS20DRAFT_542096 [Poronia punctata]|nr:hypothetical protein GGS20DRAFT_542096 [Poronia punctata]
MFGKKKSAGFQGHAYIVLQVIRFCNVAVLLAVMITSILMLIYAKLPNGFQFFADVVHAVVFFFSALLIFTEIGVWERGQEFIEEAWPLLGSNKGFSGLGAIMVLIGCHLLSGLNSNIYTAKDVPSQITQVITGSGIVAIAFGFTNIIASLVFRNGNVRARAIRNGGATAQSPSFYDDKKEYVISGPIGTTTHMDGAADSLPRMNYYDDKSIGSVGSRHSPIVPDISRPPSACHPAITARHSIYSEASHIQRFDNSNMV